jgi:hypothetical protein
MGTILAMRSPLLALLLALAAPASASTFLATSVEEVTRSSDAVVRGAVVATAARETRDRRIVTDVEIEVASAWKGDTGRRLKVTVPGGSLGEIALRVEGGATFRKGEEVVVFVAREGRGWRVTAHGLGKYTVTGPAARPELGGAKVLPRDVPAAERLVGEMTVAELERRVKAAR